MKCCNFDFSDLIANVSISSSISPIDDERLSSLDLPLPFKTNPGIFLSNINATNFINTTGNRNRRTLHLQLQHFSDKFENAISHERVRRDRFGKSIPVEYVDHPFQILERNRKRRNLQSNDDNPIDEPYDLETEEILYESTRRLQALPWQPGSVYEPIRIVMDTKYLDLEDSEYSERIEFLKSNILPIVSSFWSSALRVFPFKNGNGHIQFALIF